MKIKDKNIALLGIIFPNLVGNFSLFLYSFSVFFIKIKKRNIVKNLFSINATTFTLTYVFFHIAITFILYGISFNSEFKGLIFLAITSLIISNNERTQSIEKLKTNINIIIYYLAFIALLVATTRGVLFRFPDYNPIKFGLNSIYVGSLFVLIFAIFKDKYIRIKSSIIIFLAGSGTALSGFILYLGLENFANLKLLKRNFFKIIIIFGFIGALFLSFLYTQNLRGRAINDIGSVDRFILQTSFFQYYFDNFSIIKFLFGTTYKGSLLPYLDYLQVPYMRDYLLTRLHDGIITGKMLHNEHLRIIFHFGIIGYAIFLRQIFLLINKNKSIFFTIIWMQFFNPIIYVNSTFVLLILLSNYKWNNRN